MRPPPDAGDMPRARQFGTLPDRGSARALLAELGASAGPPVGASPPAPVLLYGAGQLGQMALAWCRMVGLEVLAVVDAAADRWRGDARWRGVPVFAPAEAPADWRRRHRLLVCISTLPFAPLATDLRAMGWGQVQPFYDFVDLWPHRQPLNNGWRAAPPRGDALKVASTVLDRWDDDVSRAHHLQFMAWRCLRQEWCFDPAPVRPDERYFIAPVQASWRPGERILDGGAHHGQFLDRWQREHPGWLAQAWAVEPDADNRAELCRWRDARPDVDRQRIQVHALALVRRSAERHFIDQQGFGSRLWSRGTRRVTARALDDLGWCPSLVKLHLEGGEWRALQGAQQTLRTHRPVLTLTVYHRRDGLWLTAAWLKRLLPDYRWLFRLHGWLGTAAVVYGLPAERAGGALSVSPPGSGT